MHRAGSRPPITAIGVVGTLARDIVEGAPPRVGGAVYYAARALAALGAEARVATRCTESDRETLLTPLLELGLPVEWRPANSALAFSFHYEDEHRAMRVDSIGDPWTEADVETWVSDALGDASWIHVGALVRSDFDSAALAALARSGAYLLLDAQGLIRRSQIGSLVLDKRIDRAALAHVTALKLNEREAEVLVGGTEVERLRRFGLPEVLLTLGSRGSVIVTERSAELINAAPLDPTTDPTGAGDIVAASYLAARALGAEPVDAARSAALTTHDLLARR